MKKLLYIVALAALTLATASAAPAICPTGSYTQYLAAGFECQTGNFTFDNFDYISGISSDDLQVAPIIASNYEGLMFSSPFWTVNNILGGGPMAADSTIIFIVHGNITDVNLHFNGGYLGSGSALVTEDYYDTSGGHLGQLIVANPPGVFDASTPVEGYNSLLVIKDVNVSAAVWPDGTGGLATISYMDNTFSLTPEPSSMILMGAGLLVMGGLLRSRLRSR